MLQNDTADVHEGLLRDMEPFLWGTRLTHPLPAIARGIVAALKYDNAVNQDFNMGGAEEIRILDLAQEIWNAMGGGGNIQPVFVKGFPQDVSRQFMSCDKARGILGWEPEVFFKDGLKDMVRWLADAEVPSK